MLLSGHCVIPMVKRALKSNEDAAVIKCDRRNHIVKKFFSTIEKIVSIPQFGEIQAVAYRKSKEYIYFVSYEFHTVIIRANEEFTQCSILIGDDLISYGYSPSPDIKERAIIKDLIKYLVTITQHMVQVEITYNNLYIPDECKDVIFLSGQYKECSFYLAPEDRLERSFGEFRAFRALRTSDLFAVCQDTLGLNFNLQFVKDAESYDIGLVPYSIQLPKDYDYSRPIWKKAMDEDGNKQRLSVDHVSMTFVYKLMRDINRDLDDVKFTDANEEFLHLLIHPTDHPYMFSMALSTLSKDVPLHAFVGFSKLDILLFNNLSYLLSMIVQAKEVVSQTVFEHSEITCLYFLD